MKTGLTLLRLTLLGAGVSVLGSTLAAEVPKKEWTVLIYMAADNGLSPFAYWDLYEMEAAFQSPGLAGSTRRTDVVVQLDAQGEGARRYHIEQSARPYDPRKRVADFEVGGKERRVDSPVIEVVPSAKGVDHEREFQDFLEWGIRHYPSERLMVIVWGHGQGWSSGRQPLSLRPFGGLAFDSTEGTYLGIPALSRVLQRVSKHSLGGRPIDVYASDACLMQMVEVAYEISDSTRFIVGSAAIQNYLGLPYRRLFYEMNRGRFFHELTHIGTREDEAFLLARMIPDLYRASWSGSGSATGLQARISPDGRRSFTSSALSSSELSRSLVPWLADLAALLEELAQYLNGDLRAKIEWMARLQKVEGFEGGAQDLGLFLGLIESSLDQLPPEADFIKDRLKAALKSTRASLTRTVLNGFYGDEYRERQLPLLGFKAFSLWVPKDSREYTKRVEDLLPSRFYQDTNWGGWMKALFRN